VLQIDEVVAKHCSILPELRAMTDAVLELIQPPR
jgi:hypothetical protein